MFHVLREYNLNAILLSHLGLWPLQRKIVRDVLPSCYLILMISICPLEILMIYDHRDDSKILFDGCYQLVIVCAFAIRLWNEIWNRDKFRRLYEAMNDHWDTFTNDLEVEILKDYSVISRKFTVVYCIVMYGVTACFLIMPLAPIFLDVVLPINESRPRILAITLEFRVNTEEYFLPIFCYISAVIAVGTSILMGVDTMHFACTIHACSLFAIISEQIENIPQSDKNRLCGLSKEETLYQKYTLCLKKYQLALEFVDILNSTHETVAIVFLLLIGATLSLVGVRIVYVLDQMEELFRFTVIIVAALLQLMIMCYSGQKLIDESQDIFYRIYATTWYTFSSRLKSLLIISSYRSIVPCSLNVGKLFPLSMETYATVVRAGASYFTAFLSFKD